MFGGSRQITRRKSSPSNRVNSPASYRHQSHSLSVSVNRSSSILDSTKRSLIQSYQFRPAGISSDMKQLSRLALYRSRIFLMLLAACSSSCLWLIKTFTLSLLLLPMASPLPLSSWPAIFKPATCSREWLLPARRDSCPTLLARLLLCLPACRR